jgi:hypothetical protein
MSVATMYVSLETQWQLCGKCLCPSVCVCMMDMLNTDPTKTVVINSDERNRCHTHSL